MLLQQGQSLEPAVLRRTIDMVNADESPSEVLTVRGAALVAGPHGPAQVERAEALRRRHPRERHHLRPRPGRHRQELAGGGHGGAGPAVQAGRAHHPHPARGRGRRAARLPARRPHGQGRPLPPPALRRALRHGRDRRRPAAARPGHRRGRAAGVHAGPHAQRQLHHPRRGPEHHARADEDVPHPHRLRVQGRHHRRHHPGRRGRRQERPRPGSRPSWPASTASPFVHLSSTDVVRHRIVPDIVNAYERAAGGANSSTDPTTRP